MVQSIQTEAHCVDLLALTTVALTEWRNTYAFDIDHCLVIITRNTLNTWRTRLCSQIRVWNRGWHVWRLWWKGRQEACLTRSMYCTEPRRWLTRWLGCRSWKGTQPLVCNTSLYTFICAIYIHISDLTSWRPSTLILHVSESTGFNIDNILNVKIKYR